MVNSFSDLLERLPDSWRYGTCEWLRVCKPGASGHQGEWAVKPWWKVVQGAMFLFGRALGLCRETVANCQYDGLMAMAYGCLEKAAALKASVGGVAKGAREVCNDVRNFWHGDEFMSAVARKRFRVVQMGVSRTC